MTNRRDVLIGLGTVGTVAIAGCSDTNNSEPEEEEEPEEDEGIGSEGIDIEEIVDETESEQQEGYDVEEIGDETESEQQEEQEEQDGLEDQLEDELEDAEPVEEPETTNTILDQGSRSINGREYLYWEIELSQESELNLRTTVRNGPNIGVFLTTPDELEQFERGNRYRFFEDISQENTVGDDTSQTIPSGDYILLINNNSDSTATVDIKLTATG